MYMIFVFFKQKTTYEMRISDWSSDVCSSDLPSATDDHQTFNAREMARGGGARMIAQSAFTPVELAKQMQKLGLEPPALATAAARAKACGRPDAPPDPPDLVPRTGQAPAYVGPPQVVLRPLPPRSAFDGGASAP